MFIEHLISIVIILNALQLPTDALIY